MGFVTKHRERDKKLPLERSRLKESINNDLIQDTNVLGFFYGGSIAKGNEDLYSDIDLRIIVKEEMFESYRKNKMNRAKHWGEVLYYEDNPSATHSVAHFKRFVKVDTFYFTTSSLQPSLHLKEIEIVHDPHRVIKKIHQQSQRLKYSMSFEEFDRWRSKIFAYTHEIYRRVMRQEYNYCYTMMNGLRFLIASGWYMEIGQPPNSFGDWANIEGNRTLLDNDKLSLLYSWDCGYRDPEQFMHVLLSILSEFKHLHHHFCCMLRVDEDREWMEDILDLVL